jgi:hypothetical protein
MPYSPRQRRARDQHLLRLFPHRLWKIKVTRRFIHAQLLGHGDRSEEDLDVESRVASRVEPVVAGIEVQRLVPPEQERLE